MLNFALEIYHKICRNIAELKEKNYALFWKTCTACFFAITFEKFLVKENIFIKSTIFFFLTIIIGYWSVIGMFAKQLKAAY